MGYFASSALFPLLSKGLHLSGCSFLVLLHFKLYFLWVWLFGGQVRMFVASPLAPCFLKVPAVDLLVACIQKHRDFVMEDLHFAALESIKKPLVFCSVSPIVFKTWASLVVLMSGWKVNEYYLIKVVYAMLGPLSLVCGGSSAVSTLWLKVTQWVPWWSLLLGQPSSQGC